MDGEKVEEEEEEGGEEEQQLGKQEEECVAVLGVSGTAINDITSRTWHCHHLFTHGTAITCSRLTLPSSVHT